MAQSQLLTIREVGTLLNLSGPRIHQLLADGDLQGPGLPLGRKRHSPGAPRVTRQSVDRYLREREEERVPITPRPARKRGKDASAPTPAWNAPGEASAKAAAQELKVRLDSMRDELAAERARNKDLLEVVERLVGILRSSQISADRLDGVTDGYSLALTQLLTPDTPA